MIKKAIPFEIVYLNEEGYHLKIAVLVNNQKCSMLLDTGASQTAFDRKLLQDIIGAEAIVPSEQISTGLGTQSMESFSAVLPEFEIGDIKITSYKAAVLDLGHVNQTYEKIMLDPIHGVLGNDILLPYNALIDYRNLQLWLEK
jgi:predicted aspartyl protease